MRVLGIETSCDETAVAIVNGRGEKLIVEKNHVFSQIDTHAEYGGVIPEVAAREHHLAIFSLIKDVLKLKKEDFDAIAVTSGPGLAPALRTGVETAKALSFAWNKPLIGVSHMEGHIYANWLEEKRLKSILKKNPKLPLLALLVSGGHTELVLMKDHGEFTRLGETIDDAAGEAFDKVAKMLGLPYPGGPQIAKLAKGGDGRAFDFPRGLIDKNNLDFSFSGLKTSVLYTLRKNEDKLEDPLFRSNIAASFEEAVVDVLVRKTEKAIKEHSPKSLVIAGGVSANKELRKRMAKLAKETGVKFSMPMFKYSLDNAAMIAAAGYFRLRAGESSVVLDLKSDSNLDFCL